jgi:uncharacterized protein
MISLYKNKYLYCPDTNTLLNREYEGTFYKYRAKEKRQVEDVPIDLQTIRLKTRKLNQLVFNVTHSCNMKCAYCSYQDNYLHERKTTSKILALDHAKQGMHYAYDITKGRENRELSIGFYGGEPLLQFELIREIVKYAKTLFKGWNLKFHITTNGTLLTDKIVQFFSTNHFQVFISLDGSKHNHDSRRVLTDGTGTFDLIKSKLENIKRKYPEFYRKHVSFSAVHSRDLPMKEIFGFFKDNPLVNKNFMMFNSVNFMDTDYYERYPYDEKVNQQYYDEIIEGILKKVKVGKALCSVEDNLYKGITDVLKRLSIKRMTTLAGACFISKRLFIDAYGNFHICEKINSKFPIGHVYSGFNFDRIAEIMQEYTQLINTHCLKCTVRYLCQRCYVHFAGDGVLKINSQFCEYSRKALGQIEKVIQLKENNIL